MPREAVASVAFLKPDLLPGFGSVQRARPRRGRLPTAVLSFGGNEIDWRRSYPTMSTGSIRLLGQSNLGTKCGQRHIPAFFPVDREKWRALLPELVETADVVL